MEFNPALTSYFTRGSLGKPQKPRVTCRYETCKKSLAYASLRSHMETIHGHHTTNETELVYRANGVTAHISQSLPQKAKKTKRDKQPAKVYLAAEKARASTLNVGIPFQTSEGTFDIQGFRRHSVANGRVPVSCESG